MKGGYRKNETGAPRGESRTADSHKSGHMVLPARFRRGVGNTPHLKARNRQAFSTEDQLGRDDLADEELKRIHLHLWNCSENTLGKLTHTARKMVSQKRIGQISDRCTCSPNLTRITTPKIPSRIEKYNGEILGIGLLYPFVNFRDYAAGRKIMELMAIWCLSRFFVCSISPSLAEDEVSPTFTNDWARSIGQPLRAIMRRRSPGMFGEPWGDISFVCMGDHSCPQPERCVGMGFWKEVCGVCKYRPNQL